MKILIITHEFYPIGGGAGKAAYMLSKEMLTMGHKLSVLTCNYEGYSFIKEDKINFYTVKGYRKNQFENNIIKTFLSFIIFGYFKLKNIIKSDKPDIILTFFTIPAGLLGLLAKYTLNVPYVVSSRGSDVPYHTSSLLYPQIKPIIRLIWKKSEKVIVLSKGLEKTALRTYSDNNLFKVIYNGIEIPIMNLEKKEKGGNVIRLISVARLHPNKGLDVLLKALHLLIQNYNIQLTIIGDGPDKKALEQLINKLRINDKVVLTGYLPYEKVQASLLDSNIFILPSRAEAFGQVFTEALSCGLPVIGTNTGGIPEIITEEVGKVVPVDDVNALTIAISSVIDNLDKYDPNSLRNYAKNFSWENTAREYIEVFEKVLERN